jgi:hypothetical protein
MEVVAEAARDLALHIDTIVRLLRLTRPPVALGGGLMLRGALRKTMLADVKSELGPGRDRGGPAAGRGRPRPPPAQCSERDPIEALSCSSSRRLQSAGVIDLS